MMISTKGRYALRIMIDLAQHTEEGFISLKSIAERQEVSMKYLEMIVAILNKAGILESRRGKDGGYKLIKPAKDYTVSEIMDLTEGHLAPVSCLSCSDNQCERADSCLTLPMWQQLDTIIDDYLSSVSIQDILDGTLK
ncbi:MAG: RrF2 family transcriptional regulator [Oscillospiraceae bacterium]|jgi:Rrf2 family protein